METIGAYKLGKTLGKGTYGKVKLGVHMETGEQVAVKIVHTNTEKSKKQLEREISIISKLKHQNIVKMYEALYHEDCIYLILEYVGGGELFDYIMGRGRINEKMAIKFFRQMVSAVGYCHKNGVCHRDLKPENLILDEEGNIKINDFGLSNFFVPGSLLSSFCGSPVYAAPEIMAEKQYDGPAADTWSLGIVLYAMVVGQLPWKLDERGIIRDVSDLIRARFTIPASASISSECEDLIRKMLVADPNVRIKLTDVASHPWVMKGFESPVLMEGDATRPHYPLGHTKSTPELMTRRGRAISAMEQPTGNKVGMYWRRGSGLMEAEDLQKGRRGSAPENFFTKLINKVTHKDGEGKQPAKVDATPPAPVMKTVRGIFLVDITTSKPPEVIMSEITRSLRQSKIEFTTSDYVFHCIGKVNVKAHGGGGDGASEGEVSSYKMKFDIEVCSIAGIAGLYGLHFKRVNGSVWLFRSLSIYLIDRMKL